MPLQGYIAYLWIDAYKKKITALYWGGGYEEGFERLGGKYIHLVLSFVPCAYITYT